MVTWRLALVVLLARTGRAISGMPLLRADQGHGTAHGAHVPPPEPVSAPRPADGDGAGRRLAANNAAELTAWQAGYDALGGPAWTHCADARDDPCGRCTYATREARGGRFVHCAGGHITSSSPHAARSPKRSTVGRIPALPAGCSGGVSAGLAGIADALALLPDLQARKR